MNLGGNDYAVMLSVGDGRVIFAYIDTMICTPLPYLLTSNRRILSVHVRSCFSLGPTYS